MLYSFLLDKAPLKILDPGMTRFLFQLLCTFSPHTNTIQPTDISKLPLLVNSFTIKNKLNPFYGK